ncbi:hypothetical protein HIC20_01020 [Buchnera aphidicola (Hormaphis cornu)]|nr:hypothetical protein HIC20_01020 [Buchnera aphidicola (Hormaphis cornu)]
MKKILYKNSKKICTLYKKTPHIQLISQDTIYKKYTPIFNKHQKINIPTINRHIQDNWTVSSFSKLKNIYKTTLNHNTYSCYINTKNKKNIHNQSILLTHSFPKGKKFGKMLHNILKNHSFSKPINSLLISNELNKNDLPINWTLSITQWIQNIINTPLNTDNLTLSQLRSQEYIKEFEFNLSIKKSINSKDINNLLKLFSKISKMAPKLNFSSTKGILKGFIDLVFFLERSILLCRL